MTIKSLLIYSNIEDIINCLPQNRPLYKDSGLWQIRSDDMNEVYIQQLSNETFRSFIIRYLELLQKENLYEIVLEDLSCYIKTISKN